MVRYQTFGQNLHASPVPHLKFWGQQNGNFVYHALSVFVWYQPDLSEPAAVLLPFGSHTSCCAPCLSVVRLLYSLQRCSMEAAHH